MENKRYDPKFDKMYWITAIPTNLIVMALVILAAFDAPTPVLIAVAVVTFVFVNYFLLSPWFGYVELRENEIFIKYGILLKRSIPYSDIRAVEVGRGVLADSIVSLKNALDHVNIKYNAFDVTTVSIKNRESFVRELELRRAAK